MNKAIYLLIPKRQPVLMGTALLLQAFPVTSSSINSLQAEGSPNEPVMLQHTAEGAQER